MEKIKYLIAVLFFLTIGFSSCENLLIKDLAIEDLDFEKQLVANSIFTSTSDSIVAFVSENVSILEGESDVVFIEDADVELYFEGSKIATLELGADKQYYHYFDNNSRPLGEYEMVINTPKYGEARAISSLPSGVEISELKFIPDAGNDAFMQAETSAIQFKIIDPPGKQYYSFEVLAGVGFQDTFISGMDTFIYENQVYIDPSMITDPNITRTGSGTVYLNDDTFDGQEYFIYLRFATYNFIGERTELKDLLKLQFEVLSEDYYNYNTSLDRYWQSQGFGLFSEPVTIHSNFENGIGIFAGVNRKIIDL